MERLQQRINSRRTVKTFQNARIITERQKFIEDLHNGPGYNSPVVKKSLVDESGSEIKRFIDGSELSPIEREMALSGLWSIK